MYSIINVCKNNHMCHSEYIGLQCCPEDVSFCTYLVGRMRVEEKSSVFFLTATLMGLTVSQGALSLTTTPQL